MGDAELILNSEDLINGYKQLVDAASNDDMKTYQRVSRARSKPLYDNNRRISGEGAGSTGIMGWRRGRHSFRR